MCVHRFTRYFRKRKQYALCFEDVETMRTIIRDCATMYRKKVKANSVFQSVEKLQQDLKWPYQGLRGLQEELKPIEEQARALFVLTRFTKEQYKWFMGFIVTHLYLCSPQGRIGGIMSCSRVGARTLLATGNVCSV